MNSITIAVCVLLFVLAIISIVIGVYKHMCRKQDRELTRRLNAMESNRRKPVAKPKMSFQREPVVRVVPDKVIEPAKHTLVIKTDVPLTEAEIVAAAIKARKHPNKTVITSKKNDDDTKDIFMGFPSDVYDDDLVSTRRHGTHGRSVEQDTSVDVAPSHATHHHHSSVSSDSHAHSHQSHSEPSHGHSTSHSYTYDGGSSSSSFSSSSDSSPSYSDSSSSSSDSSF